MSDRDIKNWDERLNDHVQKRYDNYVRHRINLDTARADEFLSIAGEFIYVERVSSKSAYLQARLDKKRNKQLDIIAGVRIKTVFNCLYLTNTAQAGEWLDLLIGINFEYNKPFSKAGRAEAQQVLNLTHANADTNVAAAANPCNAALIKADVQNTGISWIDFGVAAVQNSCVPLDAGEWIRVSISNTDQINANFEVGGEVVFIVYEV